MTREEKILMAIDKGYTCNPITGEVIGVRGGVITCRKLGYISIQLMYDGKRYGLLAHQFIWYCVHKEVVDCIDHINGFRDDNRVENLRSVTKKENAFNTKAKGYSWHKLHNKWCSSISFDGKKKHIGFFDTEEEAAQVYQDEKKKYHQIN
jgi:hypothetical protein